MDEQARRALDAIEQNLIREDPAFVTRMRADRPEIHRSLTIPALCASLYILLPIVALLYGWPAVVVTVDVFAVIIAAVLIRRRRQCGPAR